MSIDLFSLSPAQIVAELDKHIVGQNAAKRQVAVALRERWRRERAQGDIRDEIAPKNILMIGPTGVGKTEVARRLAKLSGSPFVKVEATKFTEVGYVGRDVESMIRDLVEAAVSLVRAEEREKVVAAAREAAEERLLDLLLPKPSAFAVEGVLEAGPGGEVKPAGSTREKLRDMLRAGKLDEREVEVDVAEAAPRLEMISGPGMEEMGAQLSKLMSQSFAGRTKRRKMKVGEAYDVLTAEEEANRIDEDAVVSIAKRRAEESGILFIDELDKIADKGGRGSGPDISRGGVQRDLLPIVEGSVVSTKYGPVRTDRMLFIAAGAFHVAKPSDLAPELLGRFPLRVELTPLNKADFLRILTEPKAALVKQYQALLATEGVTLTFTPEALERISAVAEEVNSATENIGARRLATVMETLLGEVSFNAPDLSGTTVNVDADMVNERLAELAGNRDLSRYIL